LSRSELLDTDPAAPAGGLTVDAADRAICAADRVGDRSGVASPGPSGPDSTPLANELALAYRAGQEDVLPALYGLLRPIVRGVLQRYVTGSLGLPPSLDQEDLEQQSWIILDTLTRRWDPAGGDFPAYVRSTFLWELWRYVRTLSPGRRARRIRVDNVHHDELLGHLGDRAGVDGRQWDDQLIVAEMLSELDPIARWSFLLHLLEDCTFEDVARALRLTLVGAYRAYRRALDQLRLRAGLEVDPDDALARQPDGQPSIERLVMALHEGAGPGGRLPGRAAVCARARLSELRFARLMGLLVTSGCIAERSVRKPGRLVYATPEETLAQLWSRQQTS